MWHRGGFSEEDEPTVVILGKPSMAFDYLSGYRDQIWAGLCFQEAYPSLRLQEKLAF